MHQQVTVSLGLLIKKLEMINLSQNLIALTISQRNPLYLPFNIFFFCFIFFVFCWFVYILLNLKIDSSHTIHPNQFPLPLLLLDTHLSPRSTSSLIPLQKRGGLKGMTAQQDKTRYN